MKKGLCILLVVYMLLALFGCGVDDGVIDEPIIEVLEELETPEPEPEGEGWRIGIVTSNISSMSVDGDAERYMVAQNMIAYHGEERVRVVTFYNRHSVHNYDLYDDTMDLAEWADALVFNPTPIGHLPLIQRVRELHPDVLIISGEIAEPTRVLDEVVDIILHQDDIGMGVTIMEQAHRQGATTFIHYSFPRHLAIDMISRRNMLFEETAERLGIEFVSVMAPDPMEAVAPPGYPRFITEDVPRQVEQFGEDTAFFATSCAMQRWLIRAVVEQGAIFAQTCCPSLFHAMPAAFDLDLTGHEGDVLFARDAISNAVREMGMSGRISNWAVPSSTLIIEASVAYAIEYLEGRTEGRVDREVLIGALEQVAAGYGTGVQVSNWYDEQGELSSKFLMLVDFYTFG